jgi:hypothetical protein
MLKDMFKGMIGGGQQPPDGAAGQGDEMFNQDFAEFVNKEYKKRLTAQQPFAIQWRLNMEYVNGNQYLDINPGSGTIEEIPKMYWHQEREVFNQISTILETRMAKISRQKPLLKTRPASSDDHDLSSAKISSMLLGSAWHEQDMDQNYEDFVSWLELTGTCLMKATWNTNIGRTIGMQADEQGNQNAVKEGDLDTVVVPPHEFFPDSPWHSSLKQCRSVIHAKAYDVEEIFDMYGVQVEAEKVDVMTLQQTSSGVGGLGYGAGTFKSAQMTLENSAVVKEFYERPCRKYPEGRFIVVAGDKTLYSGALPYMLGQDGEPDFPFIRTVSIDRPGCFWGNCVVTRCIPVQRRYNALRNRKAEYLNLVTIGQWKVPIGSLEEDVELNNAPGNIIYFRQINGGSGPEPVSYPSLPASFENEESTLLAEFTAISGVSELSRYSEAPSGVKSGIALGISKEQDDTRISTAVQRIANSTIVMGKMWLRLYRQFVQEQRILRWIGSNREVDVREWSASDLRTDDVFIENLAALSESPAQRRQMVFDLLSAGLFVKPELSNMSEEGRQKVFSLLEFGHWETGEEDDRYLHKSRAKSENQQIMQGQMVPISDVDDHMLHIEMHNRQRLQSDWDELMRTPIGPIAAQAMMQHTAMHIQAALAAMPTEPAPDPNQPQKGTPPKK